MRGTGSAAVAGSIPSSAGRKKSGNGILYTVGGVMVAGTLALSGLGIKTAVDYMKRDAETSTAAMYTGLLDDMQDDYDQQIAEKDQEIENLRARISEMVEPYDFNTDQLEWAHQSHIHWTDEGFPADEYGNIVDDPTTSSVNEIERYKEYQSMMERLEELTAEKETIEDLQQEPETSVSEDGAHWWDGMDFIQVDENGEPYYVVQPGDNLSEIGARTGFTWQQLAEYNHLSNPRLINVGDVIRFPKEGPSYTGSTSGPGMG